MNTAQAGRWDWVQQGPNKRYEIEDLRRTNSELEYLLKTESLPKAPNTSDTTCPVFALLGRNSDNSINDVYPSGKVNELISTERIRSDIVYMVVYNRLRS